MSISHAKHQRGFTLIEMSIVLVIIGLIIGGILKGQELIESARQKNIVSQIDAIRSGVTTFQDRFKSYPGDYSLSSANINALLHNGNDDGVASSLDATTANSHPVTAAGLAGAVKDKGEELGFFNDMVASNMIGGGQVTDPATQPTNFAGGPTISAFPAAPFPNTGISVIYGTHPGNTTTNDARTIHWLIVSQFGTTLKQTATTPALSPLRMYQLDNKYDDGKPDAGSIRTFELTADCGTAGAASAYAATVTKVECEAVFASQ